MRATVGKLIALSVACIVGLYVGAQKGTADIIMSDNQCQAMACNRAAPVCEDLNCPSFLGIKICNALGNTTAILLCTTVEGHYCTIPEPIAMQMCTGWCDGDPTRACSCNWSACQQP